MMENMRLTILAGGGVVLLLSAIGYLYQNRHHTTSVVPSIQSSATSSEVFVDRTDQNDLLPDLLPLPALDLRLEETGGKLFLRFSTTYYNQGRGPAELIADPATAGIREDIERNVLQRIYRKEGEPREVPVGTFLWHQEHLHYHFTDFISYDLESLDDESHPDLEGMLVKSTYCLRDVSRVHVDVASTTDVPDDAGYKICGKEKQGVSVGWGDTYYHDYPGQSLDVTSLTSGTYKLTFIANPEVRLEEVRYDNNSSYTIFTLDKEKKTVAVVEEYPAETPEIEHVYLDDPFGVSPQYPQ